MPGPQLMPGDVVAGKYRIERILGEGGMGIVLGARNIRLDEPVAIKVLRPEATTDGEALARFFREARASVRMKGEHVARVLDVGSLEDGTPYMLMELLEGCDLSVHVEQNGCLPVATAVDYLLQACEALAEAHGLGIIHRDIKPSNLFLTKRVDGSACLKVLDFGISKATNPIDATRPDFGMTQTQTVMGSPQYMAPEQMRSSRQVDGRTDIWALGTLMHELLTGTAPFNASSMPELFAMILQDPAPSLRTYRSDVPPELDAVVMQCLEKSPAARPATVMQLARMLAPFASSSSTGVADRIDRVGYNVANASAALVQASEGRLASPSVVGDTMKSAEVPEQAIAPSAPELVHSRTNHPRAPDASRRKLHALMAGAGLLGSTGIILIAVVLLRHRTPSPDAARIVASTPAMSAPVELPPAIDPLPPATFKETSEPAPSASTTANLASGDPRRPTAPSSRPRVVGPASASASAPAPVAEPPKPATTASSRYD